MVTVRWRRHPTPSSIPTVFFLLFNRFSEKDYDALCSVIYNLYDHNTILIQTRIPQLQKPENSPIFKRVLGQASYKDLANGLPITIGPRSWRSITAVKNCKQSDFILFF